MSREQVRVNQVQFERLCGYYSGDLLSRNQCKAVSFQRRLWTVTGIVHRGNASGQVILHELAPPELYRGATGSYPCKMDGVFYKGQSVTASGRNYVLTGRCLEAVQEADVEHGPQVDLQLQLFSGEEGGCNEPLGEL